MTTAADYEQDFQAWITRNVELLRAGRLSEIDAPHVAEELESMGKHDLRQLRSRLQVLTMHLLEWQYQPKQRGNSWLRTIDHQRDEIEALLLDSPSLRTGLQRGADHDVPEGDQRSGARNRRVGKHLSTDLSVSAR